MEIAIIKEIAAHGKEIRPILLPREVKRLVDEGHRVFTEKDWEQESLFLTANMKAQGQELLPGEKSCLESLLW